MNANALGFQAQYPSWVTDTVLWGKDIGWLSDLRQRAFNAFLQAGFPTRKQEAWKYTPVSELANMTFETPPKTVKLEPQCFAAMNPFAAFDYPTVVFTNGRFNSALSRLDFLPRGVRIKEINEAISSNLISSADQLEPPAYQHKPSAHGLSLLNTALMQSGFYLLVPRECKLIKPIHVMYIAVQNTAAAHLRNHIVMEKGSEAQVIEHYLSLDQTAYFNNVITDLFLEDNAILSHTKIAAESENAFHIASIRAAQARSSSFKSHSFATGGKLIRSDTYTLLQSPHAEASLQGLFIAKGDQHIDHHTYIEHADQHTSSREWYKGIAQDKGRGVFNGRVFVEKGAQHTNAEQRSHNLLLSPEAEIDTKPELEILNDEVRCTHGATVGYLDKEALFYCETRGLTLQEARFLLTMGFAKEVVDTIENADVRAILNQLLQTILCSGERKNVRH